jgi:hypothetical protein
MIAVKTGPRDGQGFREHHMKLRRIFLTAALVVASGVAGCHPGGGQSAVVSVLQAIVEGKASTAATVWSDARAFYAHRHATPA